MSRNYYKTKYNEEGDYGTINERTLYVSHNVSSDYVTFYDEDGSILLVVPDTLNNNILDAILRLYTINEEDQTGSLEKSSKQEIAELSKLKK